MDEDIATFVHAKLAKSDMPRADWPAIANAVPGRANGLFLYARLAMDAFLQPGADLKQVLSQLPTDLNDLYTDMLRENANRSGVSSSVQLLMLQAVTHATRPLRLLELSAMIHSYSPELSVSTLGATKDLIRSACGPLIEFYRMKQSR